MTARNTPWNPDDTKVAAAIAQAQRRKPQRSTDWRKPTGIRSTSCASGAAN
jgi:hypothetical protein